MQPNVKRRTNKNKSINNSADPLPLFSFPLQQHRIITAAKDQQHYTYASLQTLILPLPENYLCQHG